MNQLIIEHSNFANGEKTTLYTPMDQDAFQQQFTEIFGDEVYKKGLEYLKSKKDPIVIDVGANMGLSVLYFAPYAKQIYAIEPSTAYFEALIANTKHLDNVKAFKLALSASNQIDTIRDNDSGGIPESFFGNGDKYERITTTTLEKFMEDNKIDHVDLLKFDAEGAEYVVFPSLAFIHVASKIDFIIGEAHYFENFMPGHVPMILAESGFKTTFLPIDNIWREMNFRDDKRFINKKFKLYLQTNFIAEHDKN